MNKTLLTILLALVAGALTVSAAGRMVEIGNPSMKVFLPDESKATGRMVVAFPGGGYRALAIGREGVDWAPVFNSRGIALAVVSYRMPGGDSSIPVGDAEAALKVVADSAAAWHVNPADVGVMGSSAGGHLAAVMATKAPAGLRPAFQILFYPVITMDPSFTNTITHDNLLGANPGADAEREFSPELFVSPDTPRAFITLSRDDKTVDPRNSAVYYEALTRHKVPAVIHVYPSGGHGWGLKEDFRYKPLMMAELLAWLESF